MRSAEWLKLLSDIQAFISKAPYQYGGLALLLRVKEAEDTLRSGCEVTGQLLGEQVESILPAIRKVEDLLNTIKQKAWAEQETAKQLNRLFAVYKLSPDVGLAKLANIAEGCEESRQRLIAAREQSSS